jgi:hypothetical protein
MEQFAFSARRVNTTNEGADMKIQNFDRNVLIGLIGQFRSVIKRERDKRLAEALEEDLLSSDSPQMRHSTCARLAKWCKTGGIYADGMLIAKQISLLLFGYVLDRDLFGV